MKFQELLAGKQINWDRVKLIRHNLTKEEVAANYERGYLELYQSVQNHTRFRDCDMVISFLGTEGTNGVFQGCYCVGGSGNVKKSAVGKHPKSEKLGSAGQAAVCACAHSRYFTGGSPSGLRV